MITNDLTNQKYGLLTVLGYSHTNNKKRIWKCKCECGNITYVTGSDLVTRHTSSCGCLKTSQGEYQIEKLLKENNFILVKEKTFDNCVNKIKLRFDFYVNNSYIIEYDGRQHFIQGNGVYDNREKFMKTRQHDYIKNNYCFQHNIPIIRIPYTELDNLTIEMLQVETSKFLLREPGSAVG